MTGQLKFVLSPSNIPWSEVETNNDLIFAQELGNFALFERPDLSVS